MELVKMLSIASYIAAQILSDIMSLKIALVAGFSIDAGTFLYPITFTLRDLVQKSWGKQMTRKLIIAAGVINILMAALFQFSIWLKPDPTWGLQKEFATILGPVWRIVIASIVAEVVSELVDTEAYSYWVKKITRKYEWTRVIFSNSLSVPIDSVVFAFGAFYGLLPVAVIVSIIWSNVIVKGITTLISAPLIYLVPGDIKKD